MKQLNPDQKEKYRKISEELNKLKNEFDSISCQLLFVKDYILSEEVRAKIVPIVEDMNTIVNELSIKTK